VIHFDTSFVVDFLRETSRDNPGPATEKISSISPDSTSSPTEGLVSEQRQHFLGEWNAFFRGRS
jgi:hypothetical protein